MTQRRRDTQVLIADCRLRIADCECRIKITNHQLTANYANYRELCFKGSTNQQINKPTDYRSQITDYRLQITNH